VERVERARHPISIHELYRCLLKGEKLAPELTEAARRNSSVPERILKKLL
jgi:hypothetical protein